MRVTHFSRRISLLMTLLLLSPNAARACGGFFCTTFPMNQVSEQILFVADQGTVTTHVQIQYTGSAADFAWVLPVPSLPDLKVSHNEVFRQLQFATQPSFVLNWPEEGQDCGIFWPVSLGGVAEEVDFDSGVEVVSEERVGPYDTAVITADDPGAITAWLTDNGYRLDDLGSELLKPYVEESFYFVALKLAPGREIGDLQPLALTYAGPARDSHPADRCGHTARPGGAGLGAGISPGDSHQLSARADQRGQDRLVQRGIQLQ